MKTKQKDETLSLGAYLQEVLQPMAVESLDKMEQLLAASQTHSEGDATIVKAIEELRQQKAEGPQRYYYKKEFVDNAIGRIMVETVKGLEIKANLDERDKGLLNRLENSFAKWAESNRSHIESNEQIKRKQKRFARILVPLVALLLLFGCLWIKHLRSPERWASMAYAAAVELGKRAPQDAYSYVINSFSGNNEMREKTKERVRQMKVDARATRRVNHKQSRIPK